MVVFLHTVHGGYLSIFSMFRCWSGLSWQRLSVVNRGVLGGCVRGVYDHRPLGAAAVLAAAGLVSLATSIPGDQDACKDCYRHLRVTGPVISCNSNFICVIYKLGRKKYLTFLMTKNSIINELSRKYCQRYNLLSPLIVVNPSSAFETVVLTLDELCEKPAHFIPRGQKSV